MSLADLYKALKIAKKRPKVVLVSLETWNSLKKAGVIEMRTGHALQGFFESQKFPVLQKDICVVVNPALDEEKLPFLMPPDTAETSAAVTALAKAVVKEERRRTAVERRKGPRRRNVHLGLEEQRKSKDRRKSPRRGAKH